MTGSPTTCLAEEWRLAARLERRLHCVRHLRGHGRSQRPGPAGVHSTSHTVVWCREWCATLRPLEAHNAVDAGLDLGSGRIVASEIEAPVSLVNLV
jgi:hypothetical protein